MKKHRKFFIRHPRLMGFYKKKASHEMRLVRRRNRRLLLLKNLNSALNFKMLASCKKQNFRAMRVRSRLELRHAHLLVKTFPRTVRWPAIMLSRQLANRYLRPWVKRNYSTLGQEIVRQRRIAKAVMEFKPRNFWNIREKLKALQNLPTNFEFYETIYFATPNLGGISSFMSGLKRSVTYDWDGDSAMLTYWYGKRDIVADNYFNKLHDSRWLRYKNFIKYFTSKKGTNSSNKIDNTRSNALFINRFVKHGKQRKAAKAFSVALSMLLQFYKTIYCERSQLFEIVSNLYIIKQLSNCKTFNFIKFTADYSNFNNNNIFLIKKAKKNLTSTFLTANYFINRLWDFSPIYTLVVKRVDKQRYKNMRGKIGRFETSLTKVTPRRRLSIGLQALKYDWISHGDKTYAAKFFRIMQLLSFKPENTWGYKLSEKALVKMEERL